MFLGRTTGVVVGAAAAAASWHACCMSTASATPATRAASRQSQSRTGTATASTTPSTTPSSSGTTNGSVQAAVDKLRPSEMDMNARWEADEAGWRRLPPRAWPARQPAAEEIPAMMEELATLGCPPLIKKEAGATGASADNDNVTDDRNCASVAFDIATARVFTRFDPATGSSGLSAG